MRPVSQQRSPVQIDEPPIPAELLQMATFAAERPALRAVTNQPNDVKVITIANATPEEQRFVIWAANLGYREGLEATSGERQL